MHVQERLRAWLYRLPMVLRSYGIRGYERFLGVEWIVITTRGRLTGQPHKVIVDVVGMNESESTVYVSPANGRDSAWFENLLANPEAGVEIDGMPFSAVAREATGEEGATVMLRFVRENARYAQVASAMGAFDDMTDRPDDEAREYFRTVPVIALAVRLSEGA